VSSSAQDLVARTGTNNDFRELMFVRIANHTAYPRKRGDFFRRALRVATRHYDVALRILPTDAADGRAGILISRSRDRARVQYYDFRSRWCVGPGQAELLELARDSSTIGLRSPASKVLYVETRQGSSRWILRTEGFTVQASIVTRPQRTFTRNQKAVSGDFCQE
jgi:hypothetical protein